jgi:hypothetical protein
MMNRWNTRLLAASFLMATVAGATSADAEKESLDETPQVGRQFELKADPQGEKLDASIRATVEQEHIRIDWVGTFRIGDPPLYYHLEIDFKAKTYKATKKEVPSDWLEGQGRKNGSDYPTAAVVPGSWYAEAILITEDPPQIDLATTKNYVAWTTYSNGSMTINSAYGTCTGYNGTGQPYPTDTHWYYSSCTRGFSVPWAQQVNGSYYNWDWGWDDKATTAAHMLKIQPNNNATFSYWNSYSHAGEDYWLLQADLFVNGVQKY